MNQSPICFWHSDPIRPNEIVLIAGANFDASEANLNKIRIYQVNDNLPTIIHWHMDIPPDSASLPHLTINTIQPTSESLKFLLPKTFSFGIYKYQIINNANHTQSVFYYLNRPQIWWIQGDKGTTGISGGRIRILGKCLAFPDEKSIFPPSPSKKPIVFLLKIGKTTARRLTLTKVTQWDIEAQLPPNLTEGKYKIYVHNGYGGIKEISEPHEVNITMKPLLNNTIFNILDFGADKTGASDSTAALLTALNAARVNGGGIVFLPRGRFSIKLFNDDNTPITINIPPNTILRGEGRDKSCLFWSPFAGGDEAKLIGQGALNPPDSLLQGDGAFGIEHISILSSYHRHVINGQSGIGNIIIDNVIIRANVYMGHLTDEEYDRRFRIMKNVLGDDASCIILNGPNLKITNCDLYGSVNAIWIRQGTGVYIANNILRTGRFGNNDIVNCQDLIFENNKIIGGDLIAVGGGIACRGFVPQEQKNILYSKNIFKQFYGRNGECITSDGGSHAYMGGIKLPIVGNLIELQSPRLDSGKVWTGGAIYILKGKGAGQFRRIENIGIDDKTVEIQTPFLISPDETSIVSICPFQAHYLFIENEFEDGGPAIQFYGSSIEHILYGNTSKRTSGFHNQGMADELYFYQPSWFIQFINNRIIEANTIIGPLSSFPPTDVFIATVDSHQGSIDFPDPYGPNRKNLARWAVHRHNHIKNNGIIGVIGGVDVVIDSNIVENSNMGIYVEEHSHNVLLHKNMFNDVDINISDIGGVATLLS